MSTLDEVKQRADITDLIGSYVSLIKAGRYLKAPCPFHQEKTPSFFVFPDKQTWKCFGCGAGGDVLSFIMKKEGLNFSEALRFLADKVGVPLVHPVPQLEEKRSGGYYKAVELASLYYHDVLLRGRVANEAREYVKGRGLDLQTVIDFQLGYSLGEGLSKHLQMHGYNEEVLQEIGLLRKKDSRTYEFFRNRLIFPIKDIRGRVVGFGARALDDSQPKYLNSPQSSIFDKSGVLYGIDRAKGAIKDKESVIIVEGYMDAIAAHQHGSQNVVASMGTSLTDKQIKLLKNLTRNFIFALDPDTAGNTATLRGIEVARATLDRSNLTLPNLLGATSKLKADIKVIVLPPNKDPDKFIRENADHWQQRIKDAVPLIDHIISVVASRYDITKPAGKAQVSDELLPLIAELDDDIEREFYINKLAAVLQVNERILVERASGVISKKKRGVNKKDARVTIKYGDPIEEYCLAMLLQYPQLRDKAANLDTEHFERSENKEVFSVWKKMLNNVDPLQEIDDDLQEYIQILIERQFPPLDDKQRDIALFDCLNKLEERRLRAQEEYASSNDIELESLEPEDLQKKLIDLNTRLVAKMRERTEKKPV